MEKKIHKNSLNNRKNIKNFFLKKNKKKIFYIKNIFLKNKKNNYKNNYLNKKKN
jgi:hypothetical protein